jgi:hypothetical protein
LAITEEIYTVERLFNSIAGREEIKKAGKIKAAYEQPS